MSNVKDMKKLTKKISLWKKRKAPAVIREKDLCLSGSEYLGNRQIFSELTELVREGKAIVIIPTSTQGLWWRIQKSVETK